MSKHYEFPGGIDILPGKQGESVPSGAFRLVSVGGAPSTTTDGVTFAALASAALATPSAAGLMSAALAADWFLKNQSIIGGIVPALTSVPYRSECSAILLETVAWTTVLGSGATLKSTTEGGGVINVTSGATANSVAGITNSAGAIIILNDKTSPWAALTRVKVVTIPDAQTLMALATVNCGGSTVGVWIDGANSTTKYRLEAQGGSTTTVDTGQAFDTAYHDVGAVFDGTLLHFYFDGAFVGPAMSTLTNFGNSPGIFLAYSSNGTTAAAQALHFDKAMVMTPGAV